MWRGSKPSQRGDAKHWYTTSKACGSRCESHIYSETESTDVHLICIIGTPLTFLDWVEGSLSSPSTVTATDGHPLSCRLHPPSACALPPQVSGSRSPTSPIVNNQQQRPCSISPSYDCQKFNPLLLHLPSPLSSSWGPPSPAAQAPITQHLWGSHRDQIRPLREAGGGQVEQRGSKRVETLGIPDSSFSGKAISSSKCHIWKRQEGKVDGEWLHSQAKNRNRRRFLESSED